MNARHSAFRLDKRNARLLGVCSGVANYTGADATWIRVGLVLATIFLLPPLLIAYFVVGWLVPHGGRRPSRRRELPGPGRSIGEMRARFGDVDRRLADVELLTTSRNSSLAREIDSLR